MRGLTGLWVLVGVGCIGTGTLPLARERMVIIDPDDSARAIAGIADIRFEQVALLPDTLRSILAPLLSAGGFLVNLSVGVSSRRHRCHRSMAVPQRDRAVGKSLHLA